MRTDRIRNSLGYYHSIYDEIRITLRGFRSLWRESGDKQIFAELAFCLLTPQSRAKRCWKAVLALRRKKVLFNGRKEDIVKLLKGVRFKYKKAGYIVEARDKFFKGRKYSLKSILSEFDSVFETRRWLVENIKGMGYKEASHFLRNIGMGENLAILDRHILKNLKSLGVIDIIPKTLTGKRYIEIENKMKEFSRKIDIPFSHLDFVLWHKETKEVFK